MLTCFFPWCNSLFRHFKGSLRTFSQDIADALAGGAGAAKSIKGHVESHLTGGTTLSLMLWCWGGGKKKVKVKVRKNPSLCQNLSFTSTLR